MSIIGATLIKFAKPNRSEKCCTRYVGLINLEKSNKLLS